MLKMIAATGLGLMLLILAACSSSSPCVDCEARGPEAAQSSAVTNCQRWFAAIDAAVSESYGGNAGAADIADFPYLKLNRFFADTKPTAVYGAQFSAWVDELQTLGDQHYELEVNNLPINSQVQLAQRQRAWFSGQGQHLADTTRVCSAVLRKEDMADREKRDQLLKQAVMPSLYSTSARALGAYYLTVPAFESGIADWREQAQQKFQGPISTLPLKGTILRYGPVSRPDLSQARVAEILQSSQQNPLRLPKPTPEQLSQLFAQFAPVWEIDTASEADRIGQIYWPNKTQVAVDTKHPVVYQLPSYTRYRGQTLLQLNYIVWFPSVPETEATKDTAGFLDGIIWRVTLAPNGRILLTDSIHNCGCYHLFFPGSSLKARENKGGGIEAQAFIPQRLPADSARQPLSIRVSAVDHQIQRVIPWHDDSEAIMAYDVLPYASLTQLSYPSDRYYRRSLFADNGLVLGTERAERKWLWPSGILSPGAMRQWGHHATVFVGKAAFDEADLLSRYFQ